MQWYKKTKTFPLWKKKKKHFNRIVANKPDHQVVCMNFSNSKLYNFRLVKESCVRFEEDTNMLIGVCNQVKNSWK